MEEKKEEFLPSHTEIVKNKPFEKVHKPEDASKVNQEKTLESENAGELKSSHEDEETFDFNERKKNTLKFLKEKKEWIFYIILATIVYISTFIRTRNLDGLRDITTGTWTLGPDLDPFLFLRWAKYIVENGTLFAIDMMRYSPLGYETSGELILHPYMIAWFHKVASFFGSESVTNSAVLYPVFFFAITVIAFFFMTRKIFLDSMGKEKASIIGLIASLLLTVMPALLPRTIAGIPEKESAAFFFMFMAFFFFVYAWKTENSKGKYAFALLSGIFTASMGLVWGGVGYIFLTISLTTLIAFLLGKVQKEELKIYSIWVFSSFIFMWPFSTRYTPKNLVISTTTGLAIGVFLIIVFHFFILKTKFSKHYNCGRLKKIPRPLVTFIVAGILLLILSTLIFGVSFVPSKVSGVISDLVKPAATSRLIQTVAENRQPYFSEWSRNFGPIFNRLPVIFWLFFFGSIYLFYNLLKPLRKKERLYISLAYLYFLTALIFSRYSGNSSLNGINTTSLWFYASGFVVLILTAGFYYFKYHKKEEMEKFSELDFGLIFILVFFLLGIISARGAVRLIMVLAPPAAVIVSYFTVAITSKAYENKTDTGKIVLWIVAGIIMLGVVFSTLQFYNITRSQSSGFVPSSYTQQWQQAMAWVRENTPENSVFAHWWDYGYWIQSLGERSTILDGGNSISYWNHLLGRHVLTGPDEKEMLEFLYAHDGTHLLIDSTEIGKYTAYSSIGSNENYDRFSWIGTFLLDEAQTQELRESRILIYTGGIANDDDIVWQDEDGKDILIPRRSAALGGFTMEVGKGNTEISQPNAVFIYQEKQIVVPLKFVFVNGELLEFNSGIDAGIFLFPRLVQGNSGNVDFNEIGAAMYLSPRTVHSGVARYYLFGQETEYVKLVHQEDNAVVKSLNSQGFNLGSMIYFQGFQGPIKIWEISYPEDIELKEEFLQTDYPSEAIRIAEPGEYN